MILRYWNFVTAVKIIWTICSENLLCEFTIVSCFLTIKKNTQNHKNSQFLLLFSRFLKLFFQKAFCTIFSAFYSKLRTIITRISRNDNNNPAKTQVNDIFIALALLFFSLFKANPMKNGISVTATKQRRWKIIKNRETKLSIDPFQFPFFFLIPAEHRATKRKKELWLPIECVNEDEIHNKMNIVIK